MTVIISERGAVNGVDVRGGGPATRDRLAETGKYGAEINAVTLSGGSAYGLEAGCGVIDFSKKGIGFDVGVGLVPIVCGASLFDLVVGDGAVRPDKEMGRKRPVKCFAGIFEEGNHGAGTGASVGKYRGP